LIANIEARLIALHDGADHQHLREVLENVEGLRRGLQSGNFFCVGRPTALNQHVSQLQRPTSLPVATQTPRPSRAPIEVESDEDEDEEVEDEDEDANTNGTGAVDLSPSRQQSQSFE
jgi:hypothetical protein